MWPWSALTRGSDYFKTILQSKNKSKDIILCLENISHEELNKMLDYVYNGEVNIEQDQLDRFLKIAQRFQLEGLISDEVGELPAEDTYSPEVNYSDEKHTLSKTENLDQSKKITQNSAKEHIKIVHNKNSNSIKYCHFKIFIMHKLWIQSIT